MSTSRISPDSFDQIEPRRNSDHRRHIAGKSIASLGLEGRINALRTLACRIVPAAGEVDALPFSDDVPANRFMLASELNDVAQAYGDVSLPDTRFHEPDAFRVSLERLAELLPSVTSETPAGRLHMELVKIASMFSDVRNTLSHHMPDLFRDLDALQAGGLHPALLRFQELTIALEDFIRRCNSVVDEASPHVIIFRDALPSDIPLTDAAWGLLAEVSHSQEHRNLLVSNYEQLFGDDEEGFGLLGDAYTFLSESLLQLIRFGGNLTLISAQIRAVYAEILPALDQMSDADFYVNDHQFGSSTPARNVEALRSAMQKFNEEVEAYSRA